MQRLQPFHSGRHQLAAALAEVTLSSSSGVPSALCRTTTSPPANGASKDQRVRTSLKCPPPVPLLSTATSPEQELLYPTLPWLSQPLGRSSTFPMPGSCRSCTPGALKGKLLLSPLDPSAATSTQTPPSLSLCIYGQDMRKALRH